MMHVILEEGLQDEEYIREHTEGFEAVARGRLPLHARGGGEGHRRARRRRSARRRASTRRERHAAIFYTLGITEHACGVDNIWSLSNLVLMTGHLGYESTGLNALRGQNNVQGLNDAGREPVVLPRLPGGRRPGDRRKFSEAWGVEVPETPGYRLDQMMSGLHDGRIKALYLVGENPAQTEPNAHHVEEGLAELDFLVVQDLFLNDIARRHADVVLPASSFAEKDGTFTNTERRVNRVRKALPCPGEARDDWRIVVDLATRARRRLARVPDARGRLERVRRPVAELVRHPLRPPRGGRPAVALPRPRPSGHAVPARAAPGAAERQGQVLPRRVPAADRAARLRVPARALHRAHALPLQLGDDDHARGGYHREAGGAVLRDLAEDAAALGLEDGDWVRLVSRRGELEARAAIADRVYPGLVWMALHFAQAKVNWLTHDVGDPLIGTPEYKVSAVRVEPIGSSVRPAAR